MRVEIRRLLPDDGPRAAEIAAVCYPHLDPKLRLQVSDVEDHADVFPENAFLAGPRFIFDAIRTVEALHDLAGTLQYFCRTRRVIDDALIR